MHASTPRIDWVDYARGICIVMVVAMHSTLGVEIAVGSAGWMHALVDFTKPFRMPDFFLVSGLFLARAIDRDWRSYLDGRVLHFAYFYALWLTLQFAFKAPLLVAERGAAGALEFYLLSYIEPFGTLWFIYLLPILFVVVKLVRALPPLVIFLIGAALETARIKTGWTLVDEFSARFVYFFAGYWLATYVFALARGVTDRPAAAIGALLVWFVVNGAMVKVGLSVLPGVSLLLGFLGAAAVVALAALLADAGLVKAVRYFGEQSLTIYLSFFLPMAATRIVLLKTGIVTDVGTIALIVAVAAISGPLLLEFLTRRTALGFLFTRPDFLRLADRRRPPTLQPAE